MAKVKIEDVVDHLSTEFRHALEETLKRHFPNQSFNSHEVYRTFTREVYKKCNIWENVPDRLVQKEN